MKIGILGGSFNPIHTGHAILANYISQFCDIDKLWLMITPKNPLKDDSEYVSDEARIRMCDMVSERCSDVIVSAFEFSLPKPSYTIDTLNALSEKISQHQFILIIGADNWICFDKWKCPEDIISKYGVLIYPRLGYTIDPNNLPDNVKYLKDAPIVEVSSTFIRKSIRANKNMSHFLPQDVYEYIKKNSFYK